MRSVDKESDLEFWLSKIASTHLKSWDLGLERVKAVGESWSPQTRSVVLLVGGTNGKGSTCEYLSNLVSVMDLNREVYFASYFSI